LYGPPGTGKTSTIVAAAKRMYGASKYNSMTLELNASDARGINVVRNEIKEFAGTKQLFSKGIKLIILDEADAMTNDAQFALRRVIEKYTKNARFCLICNYVSKIIPALQSRCTRFRFAPLLPDQIRGRLEEVAKQENVPLTEDGVEAILDLSCGDMRRVLNLLQSTAMSNLPSTSTSTDMDMEIDGDEKTTTTTIPIDETAVYLTSGSPLPKDIDIILSSLLNDTFRDSNTKISNLCSTKGYALVDVLQLLTLKLCTMTGLDSIPLGKLLDGMSQVECRLATNGTEEKIQTASLVGIFIETRQLMEM
jgi:replication factor C subunit 3/5